MTGVLGLARRDGNRRYYDLLERLLPADVLAREHPAEGAAPPQAPLALPRSRPPRRRGGGDIFGGIGPAKPDPRWPGYPGRTALREELDRRRRARPGRDRGRARSALRPSRGGRTAGDARRSRRPRSHFSLRSIQWSGTERLLGSLFEFDYVWELFVPPAKRRWGWYVLPMLFRDRLVGRIEPRIDRAEGKRAGARPLVGRGFRAAPHRGIRRCDARRAPRLSALRRCNAASSGRRT